MKKTFLFLIIAVLVMSASTFGQSFKVGLDGSLNMPLPKFSDSLKLGFGATYYIAYQVDPSITLILKSGYHYFPAKTIQTSEAIRKTSYVVLPFLFGSRFSYQLSDEFQLFGQTEIGVYVMKEKTKAQVVSLGLQEVVADESQSKFGFSPIIGAQYKINDYLSIMLEEQFSYLATENNPTMWLGTNLGIEFNIK